MEDKVFELNFARQRTRSFRIACTSRSHSAAPTGGFDNSNDGWFALRYLFCRAPAAHDRQQFSIGPEPFDRGVKLAGGSAA